MDLSTYQLPKLQKRKVTEHSAMQEEIVNYFCNNKKASYSIIGMWIKRIGVKDVGELFRQVQKFDGKYKKELKMNWLLKQYRESWSLVKLNSKEI